MTTIPVNITKGIDLFTLVLKANRSLKMWDQAWTNDGEITDYKVWENKLKLAQAQGLEVIVSE
jgi:hypothetical protein